MHDDSAVPRTPVPVVNGRQRPSAGVPLVTTLAIATAWGLIAAFVHVGVVSFRINILHAFTQTTPLFQLTAPLAYVALFVVLAAPVALLFRYAWRTAGPANAHGIFAALAALSVLLLYRRIHPLAYVVVAIGIGWRIAQWGANRPAVLSRLTRPIAPLLAAALALNGIVPHALTWWRERAAIGASRVAAEDAPNVLLLILDTVRAANLGIYGHSRPTSPALDTFAQGGAVFDNAFTTASWTLPSHGALMTGVWGHETQASYLRRIDDDLPRITTVLRNHGYVTGAFMGNAGWAGHETGLPIGFHRFVTYEADPKQFIWNTTLTQTPLARGVINGIVTGRPSRVLQSLVRFDLHSESPITPDRRRGDAITGEFLAWRDRLGGRHPWFATMNIIDAHGPYHTPFEGRFNGGATNLDKYDGAIAWIDSIVGRLFSELNAHGDLDRTLVIVTSDHGELFGEHNETLHGSGLYLPIVHVPLVLRYPPRIGAGTRIAGVATTADIPATILDVASIADSSIPGRSLVRGADLEDGDPYVLFMSNRMINRPATRRASQGEVHGVLTTDWHLTRFAGDTEELYRWRLDPAELINYADSAVGRAVLPELRRLLGSTRRIASDESQKRPPDPDEQHDQQD